MTSEDATIPAAVVDALGEGEHHVLVRSRSDLPLWGPTLDIPLTVDKHGPLAAPVEVAPSITNGETSSPGNPGNLVVSGVLTDSGQQSRLVDAEGFLDPTTATPAVGSGFQLVATDGRLDSPRESVYGLIPVSQVRSLADGSHHVYVRGQDEAGNWGDLAAANLVVDKTAPLLQAPTDRDVQPADRDPAGADDPAQRPRAERHDVRGSGVLDRHRRPRRGQRDTGLGDLRQRLGRGHRTLHRWPPGHGRLPPPGPGHGRHLEQRPRPRGPGAPARPGAGWRSGPGNALLADSFGTGTLALWSQALGAPGALTVGPAAGIPAGAGNQGLAARLPGGRRNAAAFVTDTSPAAETGYHAQFAFDPHSLRTGTAPAVTVFSGRSGTGGVFAVQLRRTAAGRQLRGVLDLSHGRTRAGAWRTVPAGAHTLTVDWLAASHDRAASLRLAVDGATSQVTGCGRPRPGVESVRLGVVSGFTRTSAGTAWFDEFSSSRTTRP